MGEKRRVKAGRTAHNASFANEVLRHNTLFLKQRIRALPSKQYLPITNIRLPLNIPLDYCHDTVDFNQRSLPRSSSPSHGTLPSKVHGEHPSTAVVGNGDALEYRCCPRASLPEVEEEGLVNVLRE